MDTTYHVNSLDMHLVTVMVVDNEGHGRTVAHGIINNEKEELLTKLMSAFTKFNTLECDRTEAVLVNKSWMEINAIQSMMPIVKKVEGEEIDAHPYKLANCCTTCFDGGADLDTDTCVAEYRPRLSLTNR